ncbi:hypothetical protein Tco_1091038 [Tanacetum coccineum]|uniref:Uncharacterized protein n=1 Tax=Tanacetum coccineum TaxID=301880 RepID=A0ABQ5I794_9ASTR
MWIMYEKVGCLGLEAWTNGRFEDSLAKLAKGVVKPNLTHLRHVMLCMMSNVKKSWERGVSTWYQSFGLSELGFHDRLSKLRPLVDAYALSLAFMAWNVIACLHDMVDKFSFMAWLLACLCGMDGKVSEIRSKARNDEIKNVKVIDTGSMKEKMKMYTGFDDDDDDVLGVLAWIQVIMEYLVKISKKARIMELKRINMKKLTLTSYTPYPSRRYSVKMDDPNILWKSIELEEEKLASMTIVSYDNQIDFRISFDESDDEDYTVIYDKNSFSYKIIYVNDLKTDSKNDYDKVNMPSFPSPKPTVSYFNGIGYFKDFEKEFSAIVYNDALTSKSDFLTEPTVKMDDPNITMEEYIRLEEEKAHRRGKVYNWETATYGKIWCDEDVHDLRSVETEFPAIIFNDALTSEVALSCEPTVSPLNDNQIDFRISFDESDDEDYMVIYDKSSFSYKIISVNDLKTDSENDNDKVNMPSFSSSDPTVSYFDDFDYFKDFEKEFSAIAYNDALTSN